MIRRALPGVEALIGPVGIESELVPEDLRTIRPALIGPVGIERSSSACFARSTALALIGPVGIER